MPRYSSNTKLILSSTFSSALVNSSLASLYLLDRGFIFPETLASSFKLFLKEGARSLHVGRVRAKIFPALTNFVLGLFCINTIEKSESESMDGQSTAYVTCLVMLSL